MPAKKLGKDSLSPPRTKESAGDSLAKYPNLKRGGSANPGLTILIDTREQKPFEFGPDVSTRVYTLKTGDYSVAGWVPFVSVERKSWGDFYSCCTSNHRRFSEELKRLADIRFADVVVENDMGYLYESYMIPQAGGATVRAALPPTSLRKMLATWSRKYSVAFWFPGSRRRATLWTYNLLYSAMTTLRAEQQALNREEEMKGK